MLVFSVAGQSTQRLCRNAISIAREPRQRLDTDDQRVEMLLGGVIVEQPFLRRTDEVLDDSANTTIKPPELDLTTISFSRPLNRLELHAPNMCEVSYPTAHVAITVDNLEDHDDGSVQRIATQFQFLPSDVLDKLSMFSGNAIKTHSFFAFCRQLVNLSAQAFSH